MKARATSASVRCLLAAAGAALLAGPLPVAAQTGAGAGTGQLPADLILDNGRIRTATGWAEAMAVRQGVIVAVGDRTAIRAHAGSNTEVIDLRGAPVLPGLHDMHGHPMNAGLQELECRIRQGSPLAALQAAVAACAAARRPGEWISGGQWDASSLGHVPTRGQLDEVAPDNPVFLGDLSGHSGWANSRALESAGISAATPDPQGGVIERDAAGEPTGVLRESAMGLVRRFVPPTTPAQNVSALKWALDRMVSYGVTGVVDAAVSLEGMQAYAALSDEGQLKPRVRGCVSQRPYLYAGSGLSPLESANLYARERFKPDCIKISLDGVPTDGHTAAMVEPYADALPGDERARGMLQVPQETLNAMLVDLDARGVTVKFHAAGDAAVRAALTAIAAAREANGFSGLLHDVAHNSFVQQSDLVRARGIGATFEFSPFIWYPNQITPDVGKAIGPERMARWVPIKEALEAGALVVAGADWAVQPLVEPGSTQAVVPELNPWVGIEGMVTRQAPGGIGEPLGEPITLDQALDIFTVNSARQLGSANRTGRIAPGMLADVIVLDRNPFELAPTQIHETKVLMTLIEGEVVYRAETAENVAMPRAPAGVAGPGQAGGRRH